MFEKISVKLNVYNVLGLSVKKKTKKNLFLSYYVHFHALIKNLV